MNCLQGFKEEKSRNKHIGYCKDNESVRIEMPHKRPILEYSDGQFQVKVPFIMYTDFESILEPMAHLGTGPGSCPSATPYKVWKITQESQQLEGSMSTPHLDGAF